MRDPKVRFYMTMFAFLVFSLSTIKCGLDWPPLWIKGMFLNGHEDDLDYVCSDFYLMNF